MGTRTEENRDFHDPGTVSESVQKFQKMLLGSPVAGRTRNARYCPRSFRPDLTNIHYFNVVLIEFLHWHVSGTLVCSLEGRDRPKVHRTQRRLSVRRVATFAVSKKTAFHLNKLSRR
jgi:hypothetical protein